MTIPQVRYDDKLFRLTMTESEWQKCDDYWIMMRLLRDAPEAIHRTISRAVVNLASDSFTSLEQRGITLLDQLILETADKTECERLQTELKTTLPDDYSSMTASVIIWAIQPPTSSYPLYYATAIAASNVVEMSRASSADICDVIRANVDYSLAKITE